MSDHRKIIENLVALVVREGASDLHITADRHPSIRVSGDLVAVVKEPVLSADDTMGIALSLLGEENKKMFLDKKDIDFSYSPDGVTRFRGNAFFQQGKVGVALRLIQSKIRTLAELNLPEKLYQITAQKQGFFLCVGPVGQGKSTTLAALIESINQERAEHIITIEDPIEYMFTGDKSIIDQREVRFDTPGFDEALNAMFREDVNVAMIGEMRNPETISAAVTAAETGHLVLSTLHTNSASQTIDRIIDTFDGSQQKQVRIQLAASLLGIFSQRLIPRVSGGQVPAYELMLNNSATANLIREGRIAEIDVVIETGSESGMISLNQSLAELVRSGEITQEDARRYSINQRELGRILENT